MDAEFAWRQSTPSGKWHLFRYVKGSRYLSLCGNWWRFLIGPAADWPRVDCPRCAALASGKGRRRRGSPTPSPLPESEGG